MNRLSGLCIFNVDGNCHYAHGCKLLSMLLPGCLGNVLRCSVPNVFYHRFWRVLRSWTTVCCSGCTTRPKQRGRLRPRARLQEVGMRRNLQHREPYTPPQWSLYREAPHAGIRWTTMTRKLLLCFPHHSVKMIQMVILLLSLSVEWVVFQLLVVKESASFCSLGSLTFCSPTGSLDNKDALCKHLPYSSVNLTEKE